MARQTLKEHAVDHGVGSKTPEGTDVVLLEQADGQPAYGLVSALAGAHTHDLADITDAGTAAAEDVGTGLGDVVQLEDVGGGTPGLPAVDGSQLTGLAGGGDMVAAVYDPTAVAGDAFDMDNMVEGTNLILTAAERALIAAALQPSAVLGDLDNVVLDTPANNEVLAFDTGTGDWVNQTAVEAGLQALLAVAGVTPRDTGAISFNGGDEGQVLTVVAGNLELADASAHTHLLEDISDAGTLAALNTVDTASIDNEAVTLDKIVDQGGITPGAYTNATVTVSQEGIITAIATGSGGGGGLSTAIDNNTAIEVGAAPGTHKILDAATTITLTLAEDAAVGTRQAFTPGGAGAVAVAVAAGAGYWLPADNTTGAVRTTGFALTGYGYFEVFRNTGGTAAEWAFVGESDHADLADNAIDFNDVVVSRPELKDYAETRGTPASSSGTLILDMETANTFEVTLTENVTTLTLSNPPATGKTGTIFLILKQNATGGWTFAWPASVLWAGGAAPTVSPGISAVDVYTLVTTDAGTTWYGFIGGQVFS